MRPAPVGLFDTRVWTPALQTYGAVTDLSVEVFDGDNGVAVGPAPRTPLVDVFARYGSDLAPFTDCARRCLAEAPGSRTVVVTSSGSLAVVGTALVLEGAIVGAAVAGYALLEFPQTLLIERLAREGNVPVAELWDVARQRQPTTERRLRIYGELLQVLGDTILRENLRTRQFESATAARDEFLAVLSHELRTPLTPILGWSRMLRTSSDPAVVRAADVIERNAQLQVKLVEDLLELNRAAQGKVVLDLKVLCLDDVLGAAVEAVADTAADKHITVTFVDAGERLCVAADQGRLQQVFRNILSNALKFTPVGGAIAVMIARDGDWATATVRDTGEGIAPAFIPSMFQMFQQQEEGTRRKHPGLGIGLALVKRLTEAHGGTVALTSAGVNKGTEVIIRLPLVAETPEVLQHSTRNAVHRDELRGIRILVVEDVEDARDTARAMFEHLGANVLVAADGRDALDVLQHEEVDVIFCDLRMPNMDGYEFIRALRHRRDGPQPPVVAVSGQASSGDHRRTHAAGFDGHIDKPFIDIDLLMAVRALKARRPEN
jgi:signal transduction histidine kinase/ActR/RegA family two-component response regulator